MKVSEIITRLQTMKPDDNICVLWWERDTFDDTEEPITDGCWDKVCDDFDNWDDAGADITNWVADAVIDHTEATE